MDEDGNVKWIVAVCVALVLIVGSITAGIVYKVHQETIRRDACIEKGGSWVYGGQCIVLAPRS